LTKLGVDNSLIYFDVFDNMKIWYYGIIIWYFCIIRV